MRLIKGEIPVVVVRAGTNPLPYRPIYLWTWCRSGDQDHPSSQQALSFALSSAAPLVLLLQGLFLLFYASVMKKCAHGARINPTLFFFFFLFIVELSCVYVCNQVERFFFPFPYGSVVCSPNPANPLRIARRNSRKMDGSLINKMSVGAGECWWD